MAKHTELKVESFLSLIQGKEAQKQKPKNKKMGDWKRLKV
jgi:hypothetical protein